MRFAVLCAALTLGACTHGEVSLTKFSAKYPGAEILPVAFVEQQAAADCGAAALTSVGQYWGAEIAPGSIFAQQKPKNPAFGYSIGELHGVSERLGLTSARLLDTPDYMLTLVDEGVPVIAPIEKPYERRDIFDFMLASMLSRLIVDAFVGEPASVNHYVVVLGADEQLVYVLDPQDGYRALARAEFLAQWRELTLEFVPDAGEDVAGFAMYREAPATPSFDTASSFAPELAGYAGGGGVWSAHAR
jgi:hypothetical protein